MKSKKQLTNLCEYCALNGTSGEYCDDCACDEAYQTYIEDNEFENELILED